MENGFHILRLKIPPILIFLFATLLVNWKKLLFQIQSAHGQKSWDVNCMEEPSV